MQKKELFLNIPKSLKFQVYGSYSKNIVYENAPTTRLDIMNRIKRVCEGITSKILRSVLGTLKVDFDYV